MKKIVLRVFTYIAILFLVDSIIQGFEFTDVSAVILLSLLLAVTDLIISPVVKFFTLPLNLLTFGLFNFILACIYLYIFDLLIPGMQLTNGFLGPFNSTAVQIPVIQLSQIGVIIIGSFITSLLNALVSWTQN